MREVKETQMVRCGRCGVELPLAKANYADSGVGYRCFGCSGEEKIFRYQIEDADEAQRGRSAYSGSLLWVRFAIAGVFILLSMARACH